MGVWLGEMCFTNKIANKVLINNNKQRGDILNVRGKMMVFIHG